MHVEFDDDTNRSKKRVTKKMRENYAEDQGFTPSLGTTVPESKSFDGLESACEEIETKGQLVANQLERDEVLRLQHPTEFSPPAGVAGFYGAVKKGITALKKTNFKGLPRSDIASLESYLERLSAFEFGEKFAELLQHFQAGPRGMEFPEEGDLQEQATDINTELQVTITAQDAEHTRYMGLVHPSKDRTNKFHTKMHQLDLQRNKLEYDLAQVEKALEKGHRGISSKAERKGLVETDMALVVPAFEVFLESLANGLQSYKSGVSGKNILIDDSNRETLANPLQGTGSYHVGMGGAEYLPRRFL